MHDFKIIQADSKYLQSVYIDFPLKYVYYNNPFYRHTLNPATEEFLYQKSPFFKHTVSTPYLVINASDKPLLRASLIKDSKNPDILQVGFFEAVNNKNVAKKFIDFSKSECKKSGYKKLVIRMECHLNNSIGFLVSPHNKPAVLGLPYSPKYYLDFFDTSFKEIISHSYLVDIKRQHPFTNDRIIKRIQKNGFYVKTGNFKNLKEMIHSYTMINNTSFKNHIYWAPRTEEEDYHQFKDFSYFLKEENMIFCYNKDNEPVGFLLWYDDLNRLTDNKHQLSLYHLIKYKFQKIRHAKLAEIAVIPKYQKRGIPYFLLSTLFNYLYSKKYHTCENGWIMDHNKMSKLLLKQFISRGIKTYRKFVTYEWNCTNN